MARRKTDSRTRATREAALPSAAGSAFEPYDENRIDHNDMPPLAISDWQRFDDPDGSWSESFERELAEDEARHDGQNDEVRRARRQPETPTDTEPHDEH